VRLVQINVIVHNKKGEPVEGLTKENFTILDQGKEQQIAAFSANSAVPRAATTNPPLPPNVFSNRGGSGATSPGSVTVILFDALNTAIQDQFYARQQVLKFLRQLQPQDHVAIYVLTSKIIVLNEFTQDATSLLRAIQKFGGYSSPQQGAAKPTSNPADLGTFATMTPESDLMVSRLQDFLNAAEGKISDFANINRAETTTSAIEAIANHVARIPGRKNLVWVSASFPISIGFDGSTPSPPGREQRTFSEEIEHAARALNQANMAIYPVDARGLMPPAHFSVANSIPYESRVPSRDLGVDQGTFDTMIVLADRTGGKASYNTNDIEGAVQRAITDGQYTYTLGFYPAHGKWDGRFHELKIRANEKGLTLRHRKGYFAFPDPPVGPEENKAALDAALASPIEWTNLNLEVALKAFDLAAHTVDVQVSLDTHELSLVSKDGRWSDTIYVFFDQLGPGDKLITSEKETFGMNFKPETYEKLMKTGTKVSGRITLSPEVVNLRVITQDAGSGSIGTVKIPIKKYLAGAASPNGLPSRQTNLRAKQTIGSNQERTVAGSNSASRSATRLLRSSLRGCSGGRGIPPRYPRWSMACFTPAMLSSETISFEARTRMACSSRAFSWWPC
jgi:VWFA-related protein